MTNLDTFFFVPGGGCSTTDPGLSSCGDAERDERLPSRGWWLAGPGADADAGAAFSPPPELACSPEPPRRKKGLPLWWPRSAVAAD